MSVYALGPLALWLGLALALYGAVAGYVGGLRGDRRLSEASIGAVFGVSLCVVLAYVLLTAAFLNDEFRFAYVAGRASRAMPVWYKFAAVWGGMAGSMLLWALVLAGYSTAAMLVHRKRHPDLAPYAAATLLVVMAFFLSVLTFASRPFETLAFTPADGTGLNPLLQNMWMAAHPPSLYLGFVGWSVPFAFAMAALISGRLGTEWILAIRKWAIVAFLFLTIGNLMGSHWAYIELGWGGFWGWDPVENSAIMPWFVGAAFIHSIMIQEKRGMLKMWNMGLVTATFALTILGTFVTRSGIVESVHAFASTNIGVVFLSFLAFVISASAGLIWWRLPMLQTENHLESFVSRESAFLFNNLLLLGIGFAIWWGTFFPFISEAATGQRISVGPPFFNQVNGPLSIALLLMMGIGPVIAWRRASQRNLQRNFIVPIATLMVAGTVAFGAGLRQWYAIAVVAFSAFVLATIVQEVWRGTRARASRGEPVHLALLRLVAKNRRRYGGYIVHVGVVLVFAGVAGAMFVQEETVRLRPGERTSVGSFEFVYRGVDLEQGPNYTATVANLTVTERGEDPHRIRPERRFYPRGQEQTTTEVAIWSRLFEDVYVILENSQPATGVIDVTLLVNPLLLWIWIGGGTMVFGMLIGLSTSRPRARREDRREAEEREPDGRAAVRALERP